MVASASKMISSDISCDESFETDAVLLVVVVIMKIFSCGYLCEPEYTEQQAKSMKFSASSSSSDDYELNSSRLENLHWCTCHHCTVMPTFIECIYIIAVKSFLIC